MIACFLSNISAKYYKNASMLSRVIAKNVGDVFFETQCIRFCCYCFRRNFLRQCGTDINLFWRHAVSRDISCLSAVQWGVSSYHDFLTTDVNSVTFMITRWLLLDLHGCSIIRTACWHYQLYRHALREYL